MMWFDPKDPRALFVDRRSESFTYHKNDRPRDYLIEVNPDIVADFTNLPFADNAFELVVFDPPHLKKIGASSTMAKMYGRLSEGWQEMIQKGFLECFRVLKPGGTLIFKWSDYEIPSAEILALVPHKPLFGHRVAKREKTHWMVFLKPNDSNH